MRKKNIIVHPLSATKQTCKVTCGLLRSYKNNKLIPVLNEPTSQLLSRNLCRSPLELRIITHFKDENTESQSGLLEMIWV